MIRVWLVLACLALPALAQAKDFCVNASTGSDGTAYASLNMSACTATLRRAADVALAGDNVYVAAGTYNTAGSSTRFVPSLNPTNSGTAGNPITFIADGTVTLGLSSGTGPMIGCSSRNYITWRGFSVDEANGTSNSDTGPVVGHDSTGCRFEYLTIDGNGTGHNRGDNHTGIRFEVCTDCYAGHNVIHDVYTCASACTGGDPPVNGHNGAGIQIYGSLNLVIENNEIYNTGSGIYIKGGPSGGWVGTMDGHVVRFNYIHDVSFTGIATQAGTPADPSTPTLIHQNIVATAVDGCFRTWFFGSAQDPQNVQWINNTGYACGSQGFQYTGTPGAGLTHGLVWLNNIISGATSAIGSSQTTFHQDSTDDDHEHNVYHNISGTMMALNGGGTAVTLADWKLSPYTQDADSPAAITSDPQFVSAGADFHLQAGSPALTQGRAIFGIGGADGTTIPAGAYITGSETIGPTVGGGGGGGGSSGTGAGARIRVRVVGGES